MRRIEIIKWKVKSPQGEEVEDTTLNVFNALLSATRPEEMPRGLDNFNLFKRLSSAFEKAKETSVLELEEQDYAFLKGLVQNNVPGIWAMNKNIHEAIEVFLNAPEVA